MNHKSSVMNYPLVKLFFFLLMLSSSITYSQIKAHEAILQGDYLAIKVVIPSANTPCFNIQRVELLELTTKNKIIAKSLEGSLKDLPAGNQQFFWNYKKDNGYFNGDFDILVYLDACPVKVKPIPFEIVNPPEKEVKFDNVNATPTNSGSSQIILKLLVGGTGVTTAVMASSIKSTFNSKVATLTTLENTLSQVNGQFTSQTDLDKWNTAYADTKASQKTGLLNVLVAGSILSFAYEAYLLTKKPQKMSTTRKIFLYPSSGYTHITGLSLIYRF